MSPSGLRITEDAEARKIRRVGHHGTLAQSETLGDHFLSALERRLQPPLALTPSARGVLMVLFAYATFVLVILSVATIRSTPVADVVLLAAVGYVAVLAVPLALAPREPLGWAAPTVLASLFAFLSLAREASALVMGSASHTVLTYRQPAMDRLKAYELVLLTVGFGAYLLMYYATKRMTLRPRVGVRLLARRPKGDVGFRAPAFALSMATVAALYVVVNDGSIGARLTNLAGGRRDLLGGQHYVFAVLSAGLHACWLWLAIRPAAIRSLMYWPVLLLAVGTSYVLTGGRATAVAGLGVAILVWALRRRSLPVMRLAAAALVAVYMVTALGAVRANRADLSHASSRVAPEIVANALTGELVERATVASGTLPILAKVPDSVPYKYGATYLAVLVSPVPRAIWDGKPGLVDGEVGRTFFGTRAGVPAGPVGEAYWNFGVVGVLISFAAFGLFHRWLAFRFRSAFAHPLAIVFYAVIVINLPAPTSTALVSTLQQCALVVGVYWLFSDPAPRSGGAPAVSLGKGNR